MVREKIEIRTRFSNKMCPMNLLKGMIISLILCILLSNRQRHVDGSPANSENTNRALRTRRFPARISAQSQFGRVHQEPFADFLGEDDDLLDMIKRQSDDYGHMRFGKREFDDYGHMRFGKSVSEK